MEESRRVLDKIFTENEVLVPMNQRKKYKMVYQDKFGKQYIKEMLNSDLVYLNDFYDKLKIKEYNFAKKQMFMKRKDLNVNQVNYHILIYSVNTQGLPTMSAGTAIKNLKKPWVSLKRRTTATSA